MHINKYIAQRLRSNKSNRFSKPIVNISIISIALGVCVMIVVFAVTTGFRHEIERKVIGFGSHISITYFDNNESYQKVPIAKNASFLPYIQSIENVKNIQPYAIKAGIIKAEEDIEGIVLKGLDASYNMSFFQRHLVKGNLFKLQDSITSNEIIISLSVAKKLHLDTGNKMLVYFVQDPPRQRVFNICGIYKTDLTSYDKTYALCDIKHIQKLNDWNENQIDGFEIILNDFNKMNQTNQQINNIIPFDLISQTIVSRNKDLFRWIGLFDQNILVLLILIIVVIAISIISTQLTLMLEQIPTIGILKTIGCDYKDIRNIFLHLSSVIVVKGLVVGNATGLIVCFIQHTFHLIKLNPDNYFMSYVPIDIMWYHLILINIIVIVSSMIVLLFPAYFVTRKIKIIEAIRFE